MDIKSRDVRKHSSGGDKYPQIGSKIKEPKASVTKHKKKKSKKLKKRKKSKRSESNDSDSSSDAEKWTEKVNNKKTKKRKKSKRSESDTDSSSVSDEWAEKDFKEDVEKPKADARDEWMSMPGLFPCVVKEKKKPVKRDDSEKMILDAMGQSKYELNPYWKDGGSGLPSTTKSEIGAGKVAPAAGGTVGDQGADWLRRALTRAEEQARSEGRSLEAVAAERWGSLEKLQSMLAAAEKKAAHSRPTTGNFRPRHHDGPRGGGRNREQEARRDRRRDDDTSNDQRNRGRSDGTTNQGRQERDQGRSRGFQRPRGDDDDNSGGRFRKPDDADVESYTSSNRKEGGWRKREPKATEKDDASPKCNDSRSKPTVKTPAAAAVAGSSSLKPAAAANLAEAAGSEESDSEREDVESEQREEQPRLTDKEMNELGARLVKAEILGNETLATELRLQLSSARASRTSAPTSTSAETVLLTLQDAAGNVRPARGQEQASRGRKRKPTQTHDRDGQRARYFPDDDEQRSLKDMFEREKMSSVEDSNKQFLDMVAKVKPNDELDAAFEDSASRQRGTDERGVALAQAKRNTAALEDCQRCYHGRRLPRHLVIAAGDKAYLCVPAHRSLTLGHCLVVPVVHAASATQIDEDVWAEMQLFRRGLEAMFAARGEDVVFFETAMRLRRRPHAAIECVPLPKDEGAVAPIYFKKAILECESEWSSNHKLVDTRKSSVRRCLPRELPYFAVDFGSGGGFAHVIEDEDAFPDTFAQEIVAGMLDLDHDSWRKPPRDSFQQQREKVLQLSAWWKPHDFTASASDEADSA